MKEAYVKIETAQLLKEKGFDWDTDKVYERSLMACRYEDFPMPTQQMACSWLREEHDIDIIPVIRHSLKYAQESPFRDYACRVYDSDGNIVLSATKWYSRYEDAVEAALQYCLTNLIEQ